MQRRDKAPYNTHADDVCVVRVLPNCATPMVDMPRMPALNVTRPEAYVRVRLTILCTCLLDGFGMP